MTEDRGSQASLTQAQDSPSAHRFAITFWGIRGGFPMPGPTTLKYGGNTTCFEIEAGPHRFVVDGGTGIIKLGKKLLQEHAATGEAMVLTLLMTHMHYDHTQGLPFFMVARHPASTLYVYGPYLVTDPMPNILEHVMQPPLFPAGTEELFSTRYCEFARHGDTLIYTEPGAPPAHYPLGHAPAEYPEDAVVVTANHGYHHPRNGILFYRIAYQGHSLVIATDTEGYAKGDRKLAAFARDADVLVHDAEYDEHEYADGPLTHQGWGHSTWRMAVDVAKRANVKTLFLTHHSPGHDDEYLEGMLQKAQQHFPSTLLAREGATYNVLTGEYE